MKQNYEIWVEIQANKEIILDKDKFRTAVKKCRQSGMTGMILSVKDTSGFVLYESRLAPHYSLFDREFLMETDYVEQCFQIIREEGLKCYAAFDVFAEGNKKNPHSEMKGFLPGWQCEIYGLDESDNPVIRKSTDAEQIRTVGSIDDFGEIFVNPGYPEVRKYEIALIKEFLTNYHPDGIVLDRVRYVGLSADFSDSSREEFETYTGIQDEDWPLDIYQIEETETGLKEVPGKYFGSFFEYRASLIKSFLSEVRNMIKADFPEVEFCDYTGSWYPLYYQVGANWADKDYKVSEFPWCNNEKLRKTAYAEIPDRLLSGFYYEDIWISEARAHKKPADWYSVQGSYNLASKVTNGKSGLTGSLFIEQYKNFPERITDAVTMCFEKTGSCMIFDISYLRNYDWWNYMRKVEVQKLTRQELKAVTSLCSLAFREVYHLNGERIERNLFEDPDFSEEDSLILRDEETEELCGFVGVKVSSDQELYPDTAWISLMAVTPGKQKTGYGRMLVNRVLESLKQKGIKKIYIGQDFNNFFSGIPDPDDSKKSFFNGLGFVLNTENHFDLEADIVSNSFIDEFEDEHFIMDYVTESYKENEKELLQFLGSEFPGRWVFEAKEAIKAGKNPEEILLLWDKAKTEVLGYCMLSVDKEGYGGLGPVGIAAKIRGNHVGDYILYESLQQLRRIGARQVNIDWTILKDFYGQFGFLPERTYLAAYKEMNE